MGTRLISKSRGYLDGEAVALVAPLLDILRCTKELSWFLRAWLSDLLRESDKKMGGRMMY